MELLTDTSRSFCDRRAITIESNKKRIREHLGNCLKLMTTLNVHVGYEKSAKIPLTMYHEDVTLREVAMKRRFLTGKFDSWVRPEEMTYLLGGDR
jgi:fumarate hydratase class II